MWRSSATKTNVCAKWALETGMYCTAPCRGDVAAAVLVECKRRSDDTDLDGTTQVPGQSPELTAWLTKNLGHPTGEVVTSYFNDPTELTGFVPYLRTRLNLPKSPGSHRTLRELPRQLHHATALPRAIRQCHTSHDPPTTLLYLLEALGTQGHEAGARGRENRVENLLSGDPITCRIHRLASTPLSPRATATINVHILCRQVHAVNGNLPGRQQVNDHPWPPTPTQLQQVLFHFRTKPAPHLNKPHIQTTHSTQPTHTGLTTAITTITHMIRMDPKSTRRYSSRLG
ncbi:hypothetical protein Taro_001616 [Colocasia esculenta]|uniref:Uncharacterized protein n=1 Tax=Colocasia esculenta TaxID=4460 RepID=A0A843TBG0_COLES|nr:hypothetical protein [Colocasia esculenta]